MATIDPSIKGDPPGSPNESKNGERTHRGHGRNAPEFDLLPRGTFVMRQRSESLRGMEMERRAVLPTYASHPASAPSHAAAVEDGASEANITPGTSASIPWPGPDFRLNKILPGSVYLWACGERGEGDGVSNTSRPECCAGWVVLITQFLCYTEVWAVSGNHPPGGSQTFPHYSILAIAVAMYLILSIAAADLWGGLALVLEGCGSRNFTLLTSRRIFGACLLLTFGTLVGASTRVLFYSSFEDVELVIGAAAVLFVADVDEKLMTVLNTVGAEWRLFWVLEAIGLSFGLALWVLKLTGNSDTVIAKDFNDLRRVGCELDSIYSSRFILNVYPTAVTTLALAAVRAISRPDISLVVRVLRPPSRKWLCFSLIVVVWVAYPVLFRGDNALYTEHPAVTSTQDSFVPPSRSLLLIRSLGPILLLLGGIAPLVRCDYCRKLRLAWTRGSARFRPVDRRRCRWLFLSGIALFLAEFIFNRVRNEDGHFTSCESLIDLLHASHSLATRVWFLFGMGLTDLRSPSDHIVDPARALQPTLRSMLMGWCSYEVLAALLSPVFWASFGLEPSAVLAFAQRVARFTSDIMLGTLLWGWTLEVRDIAYWCIATILVSDLAAFVKAWLDSTTVGFVE